MNNKTPKTSSDQQLACLTNAIEMSFVSTEEYERSVSVLGVNIEHKF